MACSPASSWAGSSRRGADLGEDERHRARRRGCCARGSGGPRRRRAAGRGCGSSSSGARCRCGRASCGSWCPRRRAALDQAAQQPGAGLGAARAPFGVVVADLGGGLERLVGDDGGQAIAIHSSRGRGTWRVRRPGPPVRDGFGAVVVDPADVGLVAQQPVTGGGAPDGAVAGRGGHGVGVELAADLADGGAGGAVGEDPPRHRGLGLVDLQVCRAAGGAAGDAPVAVGGLAGDRPRRPGPGTVCPAGTVRRSWPARIRRSRPGPG